MSLKSREAHGFRTIEALDPFAAFIALAAHVKHAAGEKWYLVTPRANAGPPLSLPEGTSRYLFFLKGTVYLLEVDFVHLELGLKDSRSQDTAAEQILKQNLGSRDLTETN